MFIGEGDGTVPGRTHVRSLLKTLGLGAALAAGLVAGCKTYKTGPSPVPTGDDASYAPPPGRQVITEGGVVGAPPDGAWADGHGGAGGGGGFGVAGGYPDDGGYPDRQLPSTNMPDAPWSPADAPWYPGDASDDSGGAPACVACSLLQQNCASKADGCYPGGAEGCCLSAGAVPETGGCTEDDGCEKGLICVDNICVTLCDTTAPRCGPACKAILRLKNVGYCAP
jgi:hypothetical protein